MKTVLVTGANGFIGRHLVGRLSAFGVQVHRVNRELGEIYDRRTWEQMPRADVLIHLAAKSQAPVSWNDPVGFIEVNCIGIGHALEYCRRYNTKLIFLSSYMYGDAGSDPIGESYPVQSKNPYALTKQFSEQLCNLYADNLSVRSIIVRPFNVYGPGQRLDFLVPKIMGEAQATGSVHVKDLEPRRDYVFIDDLIDAIVMLLDYQGSHRVFNIGSGKSHSVWEVIQTVRTVLGKDIEIVNEGVRRLGEIMDSVADITLAKRELNWAPRFSLEDGLAQMVRRR